MANAILSGHYLDAAWREWTIHRRDIMEANYKLWPAVQVCVQIRSRGFITSSCYPKIFLCLPTNHWYNQILSCPGSPSSFRPLLPFIPPLLLIHHLTNKYLRHVFNQRFLISHSCLLRIVSCLLTLFALDGILSSPGVLIAHIVKRPLIPSLPFQPIWHLNALTLTLQTLLNVSCVNLRPQNLDCQAKKIVMFWCKLFSTSYSTPRFVGPPVCWSVGLLVS